MCFLAAVCFANIPVSGTSPFLVEIILGEWLVYKTQNIITALKESLCDNGDLDLGSGTTSGVLYIKLYDWPCQIGLAAFSFSTILVWLFSSLPSWLLFS